MKCVSNPSTNGVKKSYCRVVVPSEEAGYGFGQVRNVSSHKVRKDASHFPKLTGPEFKY